MFSGQAVYLHLFTENSNFCDFDRSRKRPHTNEQAHPRQNANGFMPFLRYCSARSWRRHQRAFPLDPQPELSWRFRRDDALVLVPYSLDHSDPARWKTRLSSAICCALRNLSSKRRRPALFDPFCSLLCELGPVITSALGRCGMCLY
jgi:hypothetical protein